MHQALLSTEKGRLMGVPSWVYSDLSDEEKLRLFEKDMKHRLWAVIAGILLAVSFVILAQIFGWE